MTFRPGQYVCVDPEYVGGDIRLDIGIVESDPHEWFPGYVAVAWPGPDGKYQRVFPVARDALILV